jgi:tetratricopeptide (TPR) repeat protein
MKHDIIYRVQQRVEHSKSDSDFTYFWSLLLLGEAVFKTATLGVLAAIADDSDRNRYRLEHSLVKSDGLGDWAKGIEDALSGPASQFLIVNAYPERNELTKLCSPGDWQYDSVMVLKQTLDALKIESEELPAKSDMRRWFRLFATLRNKTRAHGATLPSRTSAPAISLTHSVDLFINSYCLFKRPWAYLHRNLSGKYRVSPITQDAVAFEQLKKETAANYRNGIYIYFSAPRLVPLIESDADLGDFYFANGGLTAKKYETLSYATDNKRSGDATVYHTPPGTLPPSETEGLGELVQQSHCLSNSPELIRDYVARPTLEDQLYGLLLDDRRHIVTLLGRGGIGKTSLALRTINRVCQQQRFEAIVWFSARDVDLQFTGPKAVRPHVLSPEDMSKYYTKLVAPKEMKEKGFNARAFFEQQLQKNDLGPCLFVFDNFETSQAPVEMYVWIDTFLRLPNKALITTRLRDFKGDYPVEVGGMAEDESTALIRQTAQELGINQLLNPAYIEELIAVSEGHPYVMKILLGEIAKEGRAGHVPRLVAGRDEILTALFERTYASLSPCAQRAFMTLAAWNSAVPRVALEAVMQKSVGEITEVEHGIDLLLQYSLAERQRSIEGFDFIALPLVATVFGRKKLNVSPVQAAIKADAELLQMLGAVNKAEVHFSLAKRIEYFLGSIARRIEKGESYEKYAPIVEMIGRHFPPAWLSLARMHMEQRTPESLEKAKQELRRFLEQDPSGPAAAEAWQSLAHCCFKSGDMLGDIHAFVQRSKISSVPFADLTSTARLLNDFIRKQMLEAGTDEKRTLGQELLEVMYRRLGEAKPDDLAQMAWLALRLRNYDQASEFVRRGLELEKDNPYLLKLAAEPNISI